MCPAFTTDSHCICFHNGLALHLHILLFPTLPNAHPILLYSSKFEAISFFSEYLVLPNSSLVFEIGKETNCHGSPHLIVTVIFLVPLPLPALPSSAPIPSFPLRPRRVHDKTTRVSR